MQLSLTICFMQTPGVWE